MEYTGEVISVKESDTREKELHAQGEKNKFMVTVGEGSRVIDATHTGNEARFANHGCTPNAQFESVGTTNPFAVIRALVDIAEGEQIWVNYGWYDSAAEARRDKLRERCTCGFPGCSGWVGLPGCST